PRAAADHARRIVEENKRLKNELGTLRAGDRDAVIAGLVSGAAEIDGLALVIGELADTDAGGLRDIAQKVRDRFSDRPAVVVLGGGDGTKAHLVAACTAPAVARGVTGPALLERAATVIGGGAGGK